MRALTRFALYVNLTVWVGLDVWTEDSLQTQSRAGSVPSLER